MAKFHLSIEADSKDELLAILSGSEAETTQGKTSGIKSKTTAADKPEEKKKKAEDENKEPETVEELKGFMASKVQTKELTDTQVKNILKKSGFDRLSDMKDEDVAAFMEKVEAFL